MSLGFVAEYESMEPGQPKQAYQHTLGWNVAFSAYWFATSYKWFIILLVLLPGQVKNLVPNGEKNGQWGMVFTLGALLAVILPPIFGRANETWGGLFAKRQLWILAGVVLTIAGCLVLATAQSMTMLIVGFLLLQIGDQAGTGPYAGMVADTVPAEHRSYASGVLGSVRLFGQIASTIVALGLLRFGAPVVYVVIAAVNLLCGLATLWAIRNVPPMADRSGPRGNLVQDWVEPFRSHDFRFVWLNRFAVAMGLALVTTYSVNFIEDLLPAVKLFGFSLGEGRQGAEIGSVSLALVVALTGMAGSILSSGPMERIGRKRVLGYAGLIAFCSLFPVALLRDFTVIFVLVAIFGFGFGAYQAADWALVSDILPNKQRSGTDMGVWHAADTVVQIVVGSLGVSIDLLEKLSRDRGAPGLGYSSILALGAFLFLVSIAFVRQIRGSS